MKKLMLAICMGIASLVEAQQNHLYQKEFSITSDNDNYLMRLHDGYYSDGRFLKLAKATGTKNNNKKIISYELGQQIFTTESRHFREASQIDRPYCGYSFFRYGQSIFNRKSIIKWNGEVGVIGKASGAESVQKLYHKLINIYTYPGWQYQLKSEPGLNTSVSYLPLIKSPVPFAKLTPSFQATLGTTFTNAKAGAYLVLGAFEEDASSALWGSAIGPSKQSRKRSFELFFYFYPEVIWQGYNATVQGGLFRADKGPIVSNIQTFMLQQTYAAVFSKKRCMFTIAVVHQTKEATSQRKDHSFGRIGIAYRIK